MGEPRILTSMQAPPVPDEAAAAADAARFFAALAADGRVQAVEGFSPWPGQPAKVPKYAFSASTPVGQALAAFNLAVHPTPPPDSTCSQEVCETVQVPAVMDSTWVPEVTHEACTTTHHPAVTHQVCKHILWFRYSCRTVTDAEAWEETTCSTVTDVEAHWQPYVLIPAHEETTCHREEVPCE